ncbi:MAG: hypothetical protein L0211_24335 [Planctomycetaceae bacterium]|nr:hypothetical protein [Planctomycetaceae bacterium]
MRYLHVAATALLLSMTLAFLGCGSDSAKGGVAKVKGTASFDGKPIEDGMVYLKHPEKGTVSSLPIKNGAFEGDAEIGTMRVEIAAYRMVTPKTDMVDYQPEPSKENFLPIQYHLESKMTEEVKADGSTVLKFDLKSQ